MTIEGAIADLQNLIDNDGIPFWAKPSLQKVKETVEAERERYIKERKTGKWKTNSDFPDRLICSECSAQLDMWHWEAEQMHYCPNCGARMEGAE